MRRGAAISAAAQGKSVKSVDLADSNFGTTELYLYVGLRGLIKDDKAAPGGAATIAISNEPGDAGSGGGGSGSSKEACPASDKNMVTVGGGGGGGGSVAIESTKSDSFKPNPIPGDGEVIFYFLTSGG